MSNNLPQTLEERTQFVLAALLATGITAPWMSAFAASPDRFRDFLKAHRRMASLHIHPDVLVGGNADTKALSQLATPYFAAVDALMLMDDAELPNALRLFADRYGTPRAELLDKLQELMSERNAVVANAKRDADDRERAFTERGKAVAETLRNFGGFYAGHLNHVAPYPLPDGGKPVSVADLRGRFVASPISEEFAGVSVSVGRHIGYVSPAGVLHGAWLPNAPTDMLPLMDAVQNTLLAKSGKPRAGKNTDCGTLVGLTNSDALDDGAVQDALFSRGAMPGEIRFEDVPLERLVNGLAGRLRQTEKHNDQADPNTPADGGYDVRRVVLIAVKPATDAADAAPDLFQLTLFPLATLLPEPMTYRE